MSLSSLVATGAPSILSGAHQAAAAPGTPSAPAPGTRQGVPPSAAPSPAAGPATTTPQSADASDNPLAAYKAVPDTNPNQPKPAEFQVPTAEQFGGIAKQLSSTIKLDDGLATAALRGDPAALNSLLSGFAEQVMQQTLHASTVAGHQLATMQADSTTAQVADKVNATQAHANAVAAATSIAPELGTGLQAKLLETAIRELRSEYPTAPAELLGREAAKQLGYTGESASTTAPRGRQQEQIDWFDWTNKATM